MGRDGDSEQSAEFSEDANQDGERDDTNRLIDTDKNRNARRQLQMIEEVMSEHSSIGNKQSGQAPAFAQVSCYNDDSVSNSHHSTANFNALLTSPAPKGKAGVGAHGVLNSSHHLDDVFSFGGGTGEHRHKLSSGTSVDTTPHRLNDVDYRDIGSVNG